MWFLGRDRGRDIKDKVILLQGLAACKNCLDQFYVYLTVLDSKATGLLTVNTLFIAILLAFLSGEDIERRWHIPFSRGVLELQLVLVSLSALLCLLVVRVSWRFLANVPMAAKTEADFNNELSRLANVISDRTQYYWMAWVLALAALVLTLAWWSCWLAVGAGAVLIWWSWDRG